MQAELKQVLQLLIIALYCSPIPLKRHAMRIFLIYCPGWKKKLNPVIDCSWLNINDNALEGLLLLLQAAKKMPGNLHELPKK